ncbi:unnamed protein product [Prorocentrum cordatum]|uniref:Uncharacterized protein n=1 Tax=Prorocentrum cordatum TaxID=2364126 RepID=A0ABN9QTI9_9DINO|nr:unnamed protein product [Polarella glacialis]
MAVRPAHGWPAAACSTPAGQSHCWASSDPGWGAPDGETGVPSRPAVQCGRRRSRSSHNNTNSTFMQNFGCWHPAHSLDRVKYSVHFSACAAESLASESALVASESPPPACSVLAAAAGAPRVFPLASTSTLAYGFTTWPSCSMNEPGPGGVGGRGRDAALDDALPTGHEACDLFLPLFVFGCWYLMLFLPRDWLLSFSSFISQSAFLEITLDTGCGAGGGGARAAPLTWRQGRARDSTELAIHLQGQERVALHKDRRRPFQVQNASQPAGAAEEGGSLCGDLPGLRARRPRARRRRVLREASRPRDHDGSQGGEEWDNGIFRGSSGSPLGGRAAGKKAALVDLAMERLRHFAPPPQSPDAVHRGPEASQAAAAAPPGPLDHAAPGGSPPSLPSPPGPPAAATLAAGASAAAAPEGGSSSEGGSGSWCSLGGGAQVVGTLTFTDVLHPAVSRTVTGTSAAFRVVGSMQDEAAPVDSSSSSSSSSSGS